MLNNTIRAAVAFLFTAGATFAHAAEFRVDSSVDHLKKGETWATSGFSLGDKANVGIPVRWSASVERETRAGNSTQRVFIQGSTPLNDDFTLEVGLGRGTGAAFGMRHDAHVTLYTSIKSVELGTELHQTRYAESTVHRVSGYARIPLPGHLTAIAGAAAGRSGGDSAGGFTNLGLEYAGPKDCTVKLVRYQGRRSEDPNRPTTTLDASKTYVAGLKCPLSAHSRIEISANTSQAAALSGHGVSGALVFNF
jgi:hypothetical protein